MMKNNDFLKYIIGVSGGADSMCLLHKMWVLKKDIVVAHFNHSLRDTANRDENFVKQFCSERNIEFISKKQDVGKYATENKMSLETAGRELRYAFFNVVAKKYDNSVILTAHNKNDNAESFLMNLLRGCGLNGLCGIKESYIQRPLLNMSKKEIIDYNVKNDISWVEDETNDDIKYKRNFVRHKILPLFDIDKIDSTINKLKIDNDYLEKQVEQFNIKNNQFDLQWFNSLHLALKFRIIHKLTKQFTKETITQERILSAISAIEKNCGGKTIQFPDNIRLNINKGIVKIWQKE